MSWKETQRGRKDVLYHNEQYQNTRIQLFWKEKAAEASARERAQAAAQAAQAAAQAVPE